MFVSFLGFVSNIYSVCRYIYNDEAFQGDRGGSSFFRPGLGSHAKSIAELKESYSTVFRRAGA